MSLDSRMRARGSAFAALMGLIVLGVGHPPVAQGNDTRDDPAAYGAIMDFLSTGAASGRGK
ncbi:MAG: hypothetical protein JWN85_656 [Gammaproteobacteria bacterium]|nr:hypothetical protein [Gammaproteobacteria bacterium]